MMDRKLNLIGNPILSSDEVKNLLKLPDETVDVPKLKRMTPEETRVDDRLKEGGMLIGHTVNKEQEPVYFSTKHQDDTARVKLFVASPGGGKTTIIMNFIEQAIKKGHGCAAFDVADGNLYEMIIRNHPEWKDQILCVDYTDKLFPPALNLSALGGDDETRGLMFAEFFEMMFKTDDLARTQSYLLKAALSVFCEEENTLLEFIEMLRNDSFRKKMIPKLKKKAPDLYLWWMEEFYGKKGRGGPADRFDTLIDYGAS
jgi:hypothetical protein